jgi:hypothetical protein
MGRPKKIPLTTDQKAYGWLLSAELRQAIVERNEAIIRDPSSTARQIGIASKILISINRQNMELKPEVTAEPQKVEIVIVEDSAISKTA